MSVHTKTILVCDRCAVEFQTTARVAGAVKQAARSQGWQVQLGKLDLCPTCKEAAQ